MDREGLVAKDVAQAEASTRNPQVDTPEFKRWFGNSKVVDENGQPLRVYHGTDEVFSVFSRKGVSHPTAQWGYFVTSDPSNASDYTQNSGSVIPLFMSIQNPYVISDFTFRKKYMPLTSNKSAQRFVRDLQESGYDGIIIRADIFKGDKTYGEHSADRFVAFYPTQIKSATGNSGTFDPNNPDIRYSTSNPEKQRVAREAMDGAKDYLDNLDDAYNGKLDPRRMLLIGNTPKVLQAVGAGKLQFYINAGKIAKIRAEHPEITLDILRKIPEEIHVPIAVMRSSGRSTNPSGFVVLTSIQDENAKPIIAAIHVDVLKVGREINEVVSI